MNNTIKLQKFLNDALSAQLVADGIYGPKTKLATGQWMMKRQQIYKQKSYQLQMPLELIGIRMSDQFTNLADDYLILMLNQRIEVIVSANTKAGSFWVQNPISYGGLLGTAVLLEGQYLDTWTWQRNSRFGFESEELWQTKPVTVFRDWNRNNVFERFMPRQTGLFGINIHTQGWSQVVNDWSAGCQTVPYAEWRVLTPYFTQSVYSYTLLHRNDFM